jgi:hypothetical protein
MFIDQDLVLLNVYRGIHISNMQTALPVHNRSLSLYVCTLTVQMHILSAVVTVELVGSSLDFGPKSLLW